MTLSFGNMTINLNIFNVIKEIGDDEDVCEVNMIEFVVQNYVDHVSYDDPLKSCLVSPSCVEEVTTSELEFLHSIIEDRVLPLEKKPPKLKLKALPSHLKYAFLGLEDTFAVIISFSLEPDQEIKLLEILRTHKTAIG